MGVDGRTSGNPLDTSWLATFARKMAPEDEQYKRSLPEDVKTMFATALNTIILMKTFGGSTHGSEDLYTFPGSRKQLVRFIRELYERETGVPLSERHQDITDVHLIRGYYQNRKGNYKRLKKGEMATSNDFKHLPLLVPKHVYFYAYSCHRGGLKGVIKIGTTGQVVEKYIKSDDRATSKELLAKSIGPATLEREIKNRLIQHRLEEGHEWYPPHDDVKAEIQRHLAWPVLHFERLFQAARSAFGI